jgi:DNA-dependent RNA polymerase auxiliary subunit epsilon
MRIKLKLQNIEPDFLKDLIPIVSDELLSQIEAGQQHLIMERSEYDDMLTELSALKQHEEDYNIEFVRKVDSAINDFMKNWECIFAGNSLEDD